MRQGYESVWEGVWIGRNLGLKHKLHMASPGSKPPNKSRSKNKTQQHEHVLIQLRFLHNLTSHFENSNKTKRKPWKKP